jgi:hypothetical protein
MSGLDGSWTVERVGGLLPPLPGVRKQIDGSWGVTEVGGLVSVPFRVVGRELRYLPPFGGFVDRLEGSGETIDGSATFRGREYGRFRLRRVPEDGSRDRT